MKLYKIVLICIFWFISSVYSFAQEQDSKQNKIEFLYWGATSRNDEVKYTPHTPWGKVGVQSDLGVSPKKYMPVINFFHKFSPRSQIKTTLWFGEHSGSATMKTLERFGYTDLQPGMDVNAKFKYKFIGVQYEYTLKNFQYDYLKDLYLITGVEFLHYKGYVTVPSGKTDVVGYGNPGLHLGFGIRGDVTEQVDYNLGLSFFTYKQNGPHYHLVISNTIFQINYKLKNYAITAGFYSKSHVVGNELDLAKEREFHFKGMGPFLGINFSF